MRRIGAAPPLLALGRLPPLIGAQHQLDLVSGILPPAGQTAEALTRFIHQKAFGRLAIVV